MGPGNPHAARPKTRPDSMFLRLPIELQQIITKHMDPGTFFAFLLTSKRFFFEVALSRPLLFHHLDRLPGLTNKNLPTPDLLLLFRRRAAQCGCAAGALADVTNYTYRPTLSKALFIPSDPSQTGYLPQLVTTQWDGVLLIYDLAEDRVRRKAELHIKPEACSGTRVEILKVCFSSSSRDLAVLYRQREHPQKAYPFPRRDGSAHYSEAYKLVTFHRCFAKTLGYFYDSFLQETRDIKAPEDQKPVGLALASNGTACIVWRSPDRLNETKVFLVGRNGKTMDECKYDSSPNVLEIHDPSILPSHTFEDRLISTCQFVDNDSRLNFYEADAPVHSWYTSCPNPADEESGPIFSNTASIENEKAGIRQAVEVGMPYYGIHTYSAVVDRQSTAAMCQKSYFALAMSKTVNQNGQPDVFVVSAQSHLSVYSCCHNIHLDKGRIRHSTWRALALLAGFKRCPSSLGTVVAISPGGTRIAAADWARVLVWSLDPQVLEGELQQYFPARDYNIRKGIGRLRPTLLSSEGVVYKMFWTDETQLYATTDRGLANWNIGHMSEGRRESLSLEYDT